MTSRIACWLVMGVLACAVMGCRARPSASQDAFQTTSTHHLADLRRTLFDDRKAGRMGLHACLQVALEAGRLGDLRVDSVLADFYRDIGVSLIHSPRQVALELHQHKKNAVIFSEQVEREVFTYIVDTSDGPLSGGSYRVCIIRRAGHSIPIENDVNAIY